MTLEELKDEIALMNERVVNFKKYEVKVGRQIQRYGIKEKEVEPPSMLMYHKKRLRRLRNER